MNFISIFYILLSFLIMKGFNAIEGRSAFRLKPLATTFPTNSAIFPSWLVIHLYFKRSSMPWTKSQIWTKVEVLLPSIKWAMDIEELKWMFTLRADNFLTVCGPTKNASYTTKKIKYNHEKKKYRTHISTKNLWTSIWIVVNKKKKKKTLSKLNR